MRRKALIIFCSILLSSSCTYDHFNDAADLCDNANISMFVAVVNVSACSAKNGSLTIHAIGGTPNYRYSLDGETFQSDSIFKNLKSGSYTIIVRDAKGCSVNQVASINNVQSVLQFSISTVPNSNCSNANGSIAVAATGGKIPIQYKLNSGAFQSSNVFSGLTAGNYTITIVDSVGCPITGTATVGLNGPSFKMDVNPIIATSCATSGCHNGSHSPNLSSYSGISAKGSSIVSAINSSMPPDNKLSAQQISTITCWVENGTLNN